MTDFRKLNKYTRQEEFQILTIDELAYKAKNQDFGKFRLIRTLQCS